MAKLLGSNEDPPPEYLSDISAGASAFRQSCAVPNPLGRGTPRRSGNLLGRVWLSSFS